MSKFINREAQDLNKKILEVEEIERGADGEITKIVGTLVRADTPTVEGTPFNAESMNSIIKEMINDTVIEILSSDEENNVLKEKVYEMINEKVLESLTDEDKLQHDKKKMNISNIVEENINLTLIGDYGTTITWEVTEGDATITNGNIVEVTQDIEDKKITLEATFTNGEYSEIAHYSIVVKARELTDEEKVAIDTERLEIDTEPTADFYLKTIGEFGTTISWEVVEGDNIKLEGTNVKLIRTTTDTYVTLQATITANEEVAYKTFEVLVRALPEFNVTTFSAEWTQEQGTLNSSYLEIEYEEPISVTTNNQHSDMINITLYYNDTNKVRVYIDETYTLNNTSDISSARFYFSFNVNLVNSPETLVGTISAYIDYYFTSTTPLD